MVKHPIEYEVLKKFGDPGEAPSIFKDDKLKSTLQPYRDKLERAGLMPDAAVRRDRLMRLLLALMALGVVGVIKIVIGLSLERPVGFLVVMMIAAMIIGAISSFPRLTARGKAALSDITNLYSGLRTQVNSFSPGSASAELAMFAAVFGVTALAATPFGYARTLFPQATSSSSCGSSCGSSDSSSSCGSSDGGSSCGGGGCVAALTSHPLTVILERDGAYPPFETLLRQLDRAREALAEGRSRQFERMEKEAA